MPSGRKKKFVDGVPRGYGFEAWYKHKQIECKTEKLLFGRTFKHWLRIAYLAGAKYGVENANISRVEEPQLGQ